MNKLDALKFLCENDPSYDEWSSAHMCSILINMILSVRTEFDEKYLLMLLKEVENG